MAGNARFEPLGSPESGFVGSHPNGPKGNYPGSSLDRSGSFREIGENRMFGSGAGASRVSRTLTANFPPLSHCLMLEPIVMNNQKCMKEGELRRVLGFSVGSTSEENSFGAAHLRPSPVVAVEELKRYKESIIDTNKKAWYFIFFCSIILFWIYKLDIEIDFQMCFGQLCAIGCIKIMQFPVLVNLPLI